MRNLHREGEAHTGIKVADKDARQVRDKRVLADKPVVIRIEYLKQSFIDDSGQVAVLNESHAINLRLLAYTSGKASEGQVFEKVAHVRNQVLLDELAVYFLVKILYLDEFSLYRLVYMSLVAVPVVG